MRRLRAGESLTEPATGAVTDGLRLGEDGITRCAWAGAASDYLAYHDDEWGFPVAGDVHLFEKLCLEGFQSGLSWLTILRRREGFRRAFAGFDPVRIAGFGPAEVQRLLQDASIIRHRGKIEATIQNAGRAVELIAAEGSLAAYLWAFAPERRRRAVTHPELLAHTTSPQSVALARDLKRRGWRFVGPTTMYAFMQSMGLVDDHLGGCVIRDRAETARDAFRVPGPPA